MTKINVTQSSMPDFDEYVEEIRSIWDNVWLTNMGPKHTQLEYKLSEYLDVPYISLFTNGHNALEIAIQAFDLQGEVITTPYSFASTTHAIVRNGLTPVFCDIRQDDYTIDTDQIESLITEKTSAIVPVHVYGNICDVEKIESIAQKYNLKVIYDAAHAFGVTVNDVGVGNFGDASMFSFHATKVFHTIEGGAVTSKDIDLIKQANLLKNFGIKGPEEVELVAGNAKMNEFQAAMGICNLRHIDDEIAKRKAVVERYKENLTGHKGLVLYNEQPNVKSNYAYFPVLFDGYKSNRNQIAEKLAQHNIFARKYFYPAINEFSCYASQYGSVKTPIAHFVSENILTLPLYAELALEDVDRICSIILK